MSVISRHINHMQIRLASTQKTFCSSLITYDAYIIRLMYLFNFWIGIPIFSGCITITFYSFSLAVLPLSPSCVFILSEKYNRTSPKQREREGKRKQMEIQPNGTWSRCVRLLRWRNVMKNVSTKKWKIRILHSVWAEWFGAIEYETEPSGKCRVWVNETEAHTHTKQVEAAHRINK